jgi:hypothetical protein
MEYSLDLLKRKEQTVLGIECIAITMALGVVSAT